MTNNEFRRSLHVYNARCALTVDPARNRKGDVHTVNLETAARDTTGDDFDWANKIVVQVTGDELPDVVAVLLGRLQHVEFGHHGASRDKGYRLFRDGERLIVQVFAGSGTGDRHTVTLGRSDRLRIAVVLFRQLQRNHGGLSADVLHAMHTQIYSIDDHRASVRPAPGPRDEPTAEDEDPGGAPSAPPTPASDAYDW